MKTIVVSGITLRKGGTLTILREALSYLSTLASTGGYRVVALVHKRALCDYPNIEYIEFPLGGWIHRLWCEYVVMHRISKQLAPVYLWLSLHDVSPRVVAKHQAVYCQTSFPFYRWRWRDFRFDPKIPLFALFTRLYYRFNARSNRYLIVQQQWLREGLAKMLDIPEEKFIVAPPQRSLAEVVPDEVVKSCFTFLYVSTADCHKNFETLLRAAEMLEHEVGEGRFKVVITIKGDENRYANWLHEHWGHVPSVDFHGLMDKRALYGYYHIADCLVFPSNIETWGLPISEYMETNGGPMILTDLPYARSTARGGKCVAFFKQNSSLDLMKQMKSAMEGSYTDFSSVPPASVVKDPFAETWQELFDLLLE